jgi:hypothetical protein
VFGLKKIEKTIKKETFCGHICTTFTSTTTKKNTTKNTSSDEENECKTKNAF